MSDAVSTATKVHPLAMRYPAELRTGDVFKHPERGRMTLVSSGVASSSRPNIARLTVREGEPVEINAFDGSRVEIVSRGSVDPLFAGSHKGSAHLFVPLTDERTRCGECGDTNTPNHIDFSPLLGNTPAPTPAVPAGATILCPGPGCGRQAKIRRDGKIGAHKRFGRDTCPLVGEYPPAGVKVLRLPGAEPDLFAGLADFAALVATDMGLTRAAGPRTVPMADVEWGMYGQVKGYGPTGERCTTTGYVTKPPRITTRRLGSGGRGTNREASRWLKFTMEMPFDADRRNGLYIGMFAHTDAVFTVLEPPADRPLTKTKFLGCRVPVVDLVRGDVFYIWDEPGQHDERGDQRPRYHLQAAPVAVGDGQYDLEVLVAGEVTTRRVNGDLYVDVDDPQETPWQQAVLDPPTSQPPAPAAVDEQGVLGGAVGTVADGLDEVRAVLSRSTLHGTLLGLPSETLPRAVWETLHGTLVGMGASGGSRMGQPYNFETDRRDELAAFIAGGPAPKHERTTAGWVRTPNTLAADVIASHAELSTLRRPLRVLEPSAGDGSLIRAVLAAVPDAQVTAVEPIAERALTVGRIDRVYPLHVCTIEQYAKRWASDKEEPFDLIVMNPPYSVPGNRTIWADHVRLAWAMLAEGGRLVAILPGGVDRRSDRKTAELLALLGPDVQVEELPARSFRESGTDVSTCVVAATKPTVSASSARGPYAASVWQKAQGEPVRVASVELTAAAALAKPVQVFYGFGGETVVRYVGKCIVCGVSTWADGANDPRGALGLKAVSALRAEEYGMQGPDVCMCWSCADSGIMYRRALERARAVWTTPETAAEPLALFDLDMLGAAVDAALAGE